MRSIAVDFVYCDVETSAIMLAMVEILFGIPFGFMLWFFVRYGVVGFYTIGPSERAVITHLRARAAHRRATTLEDPICARRCAPDERERYALPAGAGDRARASTGSCRGRRCTRSRSPPSPCRSPSTRRIRQRQPTAARSWRRSPRTSSTPGLNGQLRFTVAERNLYAYLFGVKNPSRTSWATSSRSCATASPTSRRRPRRSRLPAAEAGGEVRR